PRVDGAVAESSADTVDALGDDEHVIMMRREIQQEGADSQARAEHVRPAASEQVGEGSRRHVGQKEDDEVRRQHAVDLELVQPARMQKDGIDAEQEAAGERVQAPHRVVAARDVANGRSMRSRDIHPTSPRNFPASYCGAKVKTVRKAKTPGLASARGFLEPSINVRLNSGGPSLNWGLDVHYHSASLPTDYYCGERPVKRRINGRIARSVL